MTVGLRSLGILPTEVVYVALAVEFTLLLIYGTMTYFSIDESKPLAVEKMHERETPAGGDKYESLGKTIKELSTHITQLSSRLHLAETKVDQFTQVDSTLKSIYGKLDVIVGEQSALHVNRDYSEKFVAAMKDLNNQFAVLETGCAARRRNSTVLRGPHVAEGRVPQARNDCRRPIQSSRPEGI